MEYKIRYMVETYCGKTYCGNGFFNSFESCIKFADDGFCDKAIIIDTEEHKKYTIKISKYEVK
jgi:hypothetical protein